MHRAPKRDVLNFTLRGWYFSIPLSIGAFFLAKWHISYLRQKKRDEALALRDEIEALGGTWHSAGELRVLTSSQKEEAERLVKEGFRTRHRNL